MTQENAMTRGTAMAKEPIFTSWTPEHTQCWRHQPLRLAHRLHESPLFSRAALEDLVENYPRASYNLVHMGEPGKRRYWREGDIGGLTGAQVLESIAQGRIWINLRNLRRIDRRYDELLREVFEELAERVPGFETFGEGLGLLISSPGAQTYYHADLPGQALWQIMGRKRLWLYPATEPFLSPEHLEGIALFGHEMDIPYHEWYDRYAQAYDLEPGQMMHWPLNAPHRVENYDCLNVSMTIEYWTDEIRRRHMVNVANGILREGFGVAPRSRAITGPGFLAKAALQKALKGRNWSKRDPAKRGRPPVDFRLDRERPGQIVDLAPAA